MKNWLLESPKLAAVAICGLLLLNALFPVIDEQEISQAKHEVHRQLAAVRDCRNRFGTNENAIAEIKDLATLCKTKRGAIVGVIQ